jgi:hypothetical protein
LIEECERKSEKPVPVTNFFLCCWCVCVRERERERRIGSEEALEIEKFSSLLLVRGERAPENLPDVIWTGRSVMVWAGRRWVC